MEAPQHELDPPKRSASDVGHAAVKALVAGLPVIGGPLSEVFSLVFQPPIERRRDAWMEEVADVLRRLLAEGFTIEQLQKNEQFITAVLHATQVAIRTHHAEKLEALKNAMTNIAKGHGPDETWQQIYFGFIDSFTELHLRVLKWARSRYVPDDVERGVPLELLQDAIPTLRGNRELADTIWEDLGRRGLVQPEQLSGLASPSKNRIALTQKFTTNMGDALLRFVEDAA